MKLSKRVISIKEGTYWKVTGILVRIDKVEDEYIYFTTVKSNYPYSLHYDNFMYHSIEVT